MEKKIESALELSAAIISLIIVIYWITHNEEVIKNPYLLGLFRGIICTVLLRHYIKRLILIITDK